MPKSAEGYPVTDRQFDFEDPWRIFRIMGELVEGFEVLSRFGPSVSIFGSSRMARSHRYYRLTEQIATALVKAGYAIITGAGPGIMEAANKGALKAGGESIGLNIEIPIQKPNRYIKTKVDFRYFFCRKVVFAKYSKAFVVMPGGYGTLDEFSEAITLIQTQRVDPFPVILVGREYWRGLIDWLKQHALREGLIDRADLGIFTQAETPEDVVSTIQKFYRHQMV